MSAQSSVTTNKNKRIIVEGENKTVLAGVSAKILGQLRELGKAKNPPTGLYIT